MRMDHPSLLILVALMVIPLLLQDTIVASQQTAKYCPGTLPPVAATASIFPPAPSAPRHLSPGGTSTATAAMSALADVTRQRALVAASLSASAAGSAAEMLTAPRASEGGRTIPPGALEAVTELALEGDGGYWITHVITPLFQLLALEVKKM